MSTPDLAEPIIGYRAWDVAGGVLEAIAGHEQWQPGVATVAHCREQDLQSGYYAIAAAPSYYHINAYLPLLQGTNLVAGGRTYVVTSTSSGANVHSYTISSEVIPGANVLVRRNPPPPHQGPEWGCGCGLHAYKTEAEFFAAGHHYQVWGTVALWGHVIEHETGYRAQYGYPVELHCRDAKLAAKLEKAYGVPVIVAGQTGDPAISDANRWAFANGLADSFQYALSEPVDDRSRLKRLEHWSYQAPTWQIAVVVVAACFALAAMIVAVGTLVISLL